MTSLAGGRIFAVVPKVKRRRKLPNQVEQARREAWGRRWGAILSAHSKSYKPQGG